MNTTITFPPAAPTLKLARPSAEKWAATLAEERRRLLEDQDALREREENLRAYESRLRALQAEIEAGRAGHAPAAAHAPVAPAVRHTAPVFQRPASRAPFADDGALQAAWDKLHRARELLEAEQSHLRDERIAQREHDAALKQRAADLAAREARLAEREALVAAALPPDAEASAAVADAPHAGGVSRFTSAPFKIARSVFGGGKA